MDETSLDQLENGHVQLRVTVIASSSSPISLHVLSLCMLIPASFHCFLIHFFRQCVFEHDTEKDVAIKSKAAVRSVFDAADKENMGHNKSNAMT